MTERRDQTGAGGGPQARRAGAGGGREPEARRAGPARGGEPEARGAGAGGGGEPEALRDELADIAAEQAALEAELALFAEEYERRVGALLAELRALDPHLPGHRSRRRRRARRAARAATAAPPTEATPPAELKRLFREAAKRMHPDLAADPEERGHAEAFMKRLNEAYRAGDGGAIADLIEQWDASPYGHAPSPAPPRVAGLEGAVERARAQLEALRATDLAALMEATMAAAAEGRDHLAELRADAEAALAAARARIG